MPRSSCEATRVWQRKIALLLQVASKDSNARHEIAVDGERVLGELVASGKRAIDVEIEKSARREELLLILNGLRQDFVSLGTIIAGEIEPTHQESLASALTNRLAELERIATLLREDAESGPIRLSAHSTRRTNPARSKLSEILEELDAATRSTPYDRGSYFAFLRTVGAQLQSRSFSSLLADQIPDDGTTSRS